MSFLFTGIIFIVVKMNSLFLFFISDTRFDFELNVKVENLIIY